MCPTSGDVTSPHSGLCLVEEGESCTRFLLCLEDQAGSLQGSHGTMEGTGLMASHGHVLPLITPLPGCTQPSSQASVAQRASEPRRGWGKGRSSQGGGTPLGKSESAHGLCSAQLGCHKCGGSVPCAPTGATHSRPQAVLVPHRALVPSPQLRYR